MKIVTVLLAAVLLLAGCGGSSDGSDAGEPAATTTTSAAPSPSAAPSDEPSDAGVVVDIRIADGKATPQGDRVEATVGEPITLRITSDADEEIHVHSEPEHSYEVAPGDSVTETFTIDTPGQVAVEAHHLDVTIVQLVVRP
jgi:hypothetical protein